MFKSWLTLNCQHYTDYLEWQFDLILLLSANCVQLIPYSNCPFCILKVLCKISHALYLCCAFSSHFCYVLLCVKSLLAGSDGKTLVQAHEEDHRAVGDNRERSREDDLVWGRTEASVWVQAGNEVVLFCVHEMVCIRWGHNFGCIQS